MSDPFSGEEWEKFADDVLGGLVPKLRDTFCTVSLVPPKPGRTDVKFAVELGFSVMFDKPIIAIITRGAQVPAKLIAIADEIVEGDIGDPDFTERFHAAVDRVLGR